MWWSALFFVIFSLLCSAFSNKHYLELTTNGPVYYKSSLTISAELKNASEATYNWTFRASLPNGLFVKRISSGVTAQINGTFDVHEDQAREFEMIVTVSHILLPHIFASNTVKFVLTNKIPMILHFAQNGTVLSPKDDVVKVCSCEIAEASTRINDPSGYFQRNGTQLTIRWELNHGIRVKNATFSMKYPSAPGRRQDELQVFVTATDWNNAYIADGSASAFIEPRDPVLGLNVTGQLWLQKGNLTQLDFTGNASTPIFYCVKYASPATNITDFNCSDMDYMRLEEFHFSVTHYFGSEGDHEVMIAVRNEVNQILHWAPFKSIYIVHVYGVVAKGLFSLFIVPISCVIIGTIVAVSGYVLYERTKGDMRVEVANFDFAGNSAREDLDPSLVERTFWTHLRDELAQSSPLLRFLARSSHQSSGEATCDRDEQSLVST